MSPYFLLLVLVALTAGQRCPPCIPEEQCDTPQKSECPAGIVKDRCGCCDVCGNEEGNLCQHPDVKYEDFQGFCGENLECVVRRDLPKGVRSEAVCVCEMTDMLCGSDNHTYSSMCRLLASASKKQKKIKVTNKGPCSAAPVIVSPPEHVRNLTGDNVVLACEVKGFPIPSVEWSFKRGNKVHFLPSDDEHISVNTRGGPEKYQITAWVQIIDVQREHAGDYTCMAQNDFGMTEKTARVMVYERGDERIRR